VKTWFQILLAFEFNLYRYCSGVLVKDGRDVVKTERPLKAGQRTFLMFNKALNPIGGEGGIRVQLGFNKVGRYKLNSVYP
jgi:hypothetical protein